MKTYLENEIEESLISKVNYYRYQYSSGRRIEIKAGVHSGKNGVIQGIPHDKNKPLIKGKVRVWIDGYSCKDIFDFDKNEIVFEFLRLR